MSKIVVLDTEAFQSKQYNVDGKLFTKLKSLIKEDKMKLYITSIIDCENKARIKKKCDEIKSIFKKNDKNFYMMKGIDEFRISISREKLDEYTKRKIDDYNNFITNYAEIINIEKINTNNIMDAYFNNKPPFDKADKKYEFPDAISVTTIKEWLGDRRSGIIISNDKDISSLVESLGLSESIKVYKEGSSGFSMDIGLTYHNRKVLKSGNFQSS